jgi:hypothetical protein
LDESLLIDVAEESLDVEEQEVCGVGAGGRASRGVGVSAGLTTFDIGLWHRITANGVRRAVVRRA